MTRMANKQSLALMTVLYKYEKFMVPLRDYRGLRIELDRFLT